MMSRRRAVLAGFLGVLTLPSAGAHAEPPVVPPPAEQPGPGPDADARRKDEARDHFQRGIALFDDESWDAAFVEFTRARKLFPTRAATKNAAVCLRLLKRYEEALDMFEELIAFPNLNKEDRELSEHEITALRRLVGTIEIAGVEPGASVLIDRRVRGTTPLKPVRVVVGTHEVRVVREGFEPYATRIRVAGNESVRVTPQLVRLGTQMTPPPPVAPIVKQRDLLTPAAIMLGLGGASLGVGAVFGGLTLSKASAIHDHCVDDICPIAQLPAAQSARTLATTSTVGFVIGGVLATTGITLLVLHTRARAVSTSMVLGPSSLLVQGAF
ncbi:Hypothetical protein A7982_06119 [Minicystis rosea]|nr:Hypothetical protein A7982_06119 [Minicystis rosea]